jgi:protein tyrosine/serine phosphatase
MVSAICFLHTAAADPDSANVPNFHTVAPGIYRGAAPTDAGFKQLKAMGIKTIIDLRIAPRLVKKERAEALSLGFTWINLPMGSDPPTKKQVAVFLSTVKQAPSKPVFVHCQHGADRTGCMIGIWRETSQGWPFAQTFAEMRRYGFNPRWQHLTDAVKERARS